MGTRPEKIREILRREISTIIQQEIKDPRIGFVTVTKVEVSKDLKYAYAYYSVMGKEKEARGTRFALMSAAGYIRKLVGDRVKIRLVPEIKFRIDKSLESTKRIYEILETIKKERENDEHREGDRDDKEI